MPETETVGLMLGRVAATVAAPEFRTAPTSTSNRFTLNGTSALKMPSLTLAAWRLALALAVAPALAAAVDASDGTESVGTAVAGGAPVTPVFV